MTIFEPDFQTRIMFVFSFVLSKASNVKACVQGDGYKYNISLLCREVKFFLIRASIVV